jgi:hypothetical protein
VTSTSNTASDGTALTCRSAARSRCNRYRKFHKTRTEERADRVAALAERLGLPRAALDGGEELSPLPGIAPAVRTRPFETTPAESLYPNAVAAKLAIADALGLPLGRLPEEQRAWIDALLHETLDRAVVLGRVQEHFRKTGVRS